MTFTFDRIRRVELQPSIQIYELRTRATFRLAKSFFSFHCFDQQSDLSINLYTMALHTPLSINASCKKDKADSDTSNS